MAASFLNGRDESRSELLKDKQKKRDERRLRKFGLKSLFFLVTFVP